MPYTYSSLGSRSLETMRNCWVDSEHKVKLGHSLVDAWWLLGTLGPERAIEHVARFYWRGLSFATRHFTVDELRGLLSHVHAEDSQAQLGETARQWAADDDWSEDFLFFRDKTVPKLLALRPAEYDGAMELVRVLSGVDFTQDELADFLLMVSSMSLQVMGDA